MKTTQDIKLTLTFRASVDDDKIIRSGNGEEAQKMDLALLHKFLSRENTKNAQLYVASMIACAIGFFYEDDIMDAVGMRDYSSLAVFHSSIDHLEGEIGDEWRKCIAGDEHLAYQALESVENCFDVALIDGSFDFGEE